MLKVMSIIQKIKSKFSSERGEIAESLTIIGGFIVGIVLMVGVPMITMSQKTDDITTLSAQTLTTEFANKVITTGELTGDDYQKFEAALAATGNSYDIELELSFLDENLSKKTTQAQHDKIGENVSYKMYTSQILDMILKDGKKLKLTEGCMIAVRVRNTNETLYEQLSGNENPIVAQAGGLITANGSGN